jgi:uncharacterized protein (TIGR02246 family)
VDATQKSGDEPAVRGLIEHWADAVRRKDLPEILRNHSPDMVMFDVPPPFRSLGLDEYRKTWELFFACAPEPVVFDIIEMRVTAGRDVAFVVAVMRCSGGESRGQDVQLLEFRLTVGLRKTDGQWVVTHEHHSIPAEA